MDKKLRNIYKKSFSEMTDAEFDLLMQHEMEEADKAIKEFDRKKKEANCTITKHKVQWVLYVTYNWLGRNDIINREIYLSSKWQAENMKKEMLQSEFVECVTLMRLH